MHKSRNNITPGLPVVFTRIKKTGMPFFQPKLSINQPNDLYEQEADVMADKVMCMPMASAGSHPFFTPVSNSLSPGRDRAIRRKCAHCEEEEKLQRKEKNADATETNEALENYAGGLSGSGNELPGSAKTFFENRMGYDFGDVRVHTDSVAAKSAQSINALAYTSGNNIVFNQNQFSPETDHGKRLLAHELTHVVQQQSQVSRRMIQRESFIDCSDQQQTDLKKAYNSGRSMLSSAVDLVSESFLKAKTELAIMLSFGNASVDTVTKVSEVLTTTENNFNSATFECEAGQGWFCSGNRAYVKPGPAYFGSGSIHICTDNVKPLDGLAASLTLIHEATHRFALTSDKAYYSADDTNPCIITSDVAVLSASNALNNADSYACLVQLLNNVSLDEMSKTKEFLEGKTITGIYMGEDFNVDLNSTDTSTPFFKVKLSDARDALDIPGVQMRWVIEGDDHIRYRMIGQHDNQVFDFGPGDTHGFAKIGLKTRALLKERGIKKGQVLCRVKLPGGKEQLYTKDISFSTG